MKRKVPEDFLNEKREMRRQPIAKLFIIIFALAIVLTIIITFEFMVDE